MIEITPFNDQIRPPHYIQFSEHEPKDVIRSWGLNFNLGNVIKYISRAGHKSDDVLEDLNKAKTYLEFEIEAIEKETARIERNGFEEAKSEIRNRYRLISEGGSYNEIPVSK